VTGFHEVAAEGWACWAFSNHDVARHATRWQSMTGPAQRAYRGLMMSLRGSACIYQGEELGLTEADVAFEDLQDPYGIEFWPEFKGRDGCRTPMVWERDNAQGGFSTAPRTWLPVASEHLAQAVSAAEEDPAALLHHYRRVIAFRHAHPSLMRGAIEALTVQGDVISFIRRLGDEADLLRPQHERETCRPSCAGKGALGPLDGLNSAGPRARDGNCTWGHWQPASASSIPRAGIRGGRKWPN
jgi:alpha-glucosidase